MYVVEHSDGLLLIDAGQDRQSVTDRRRYYPRGPLGWIYGRLGRFDIGSDETLVAGLRALGHSAGDVTHVIVTHLHQDHMGCIGDLPNARVLVADAEWRAAVRAGSVLEGYLRRHIELPGVRWERLALEAAAPAAASPFERAHDVFGDGAVLVLPTPGHSPGSVSVLVTATGIPPLLFVGDLTFDLDVFDQGKVPGVGDAKALQASSEAVRGLRERHPELAILPAHDPAAAGALARATGGVRR
ncbi:N-acyl homoserine lactonase family protein [soil metagenome]